MKDVYVVMKDGRTFFGPIWYWRPLEGWFTLVLDPLHYPNMTESEVAGMVFRLEEIESAIEKNVHTHITTIEDVDLLLLAASERKQLA